MWSWEDMSLKKAHRLLLLRSDQNPECLAHEEPSHKSRYIICIEFAERPDGKPLEAYTEALPKATGDLEKVISGGTV